ncbi:MAG TPA: hypothetical protein VN975_05365 [Xanthobacteraceae bacterium]|nr:hypothetical protein [Xanthobacteraceae bacterium]
MIRARRGASLALFIACWSPAASSADCARESAILADEQSQLPRLDVASPADRPPYCITLETLMAFAARVKAHVARCPSSNYAPALADWDKMQAGYAKLFNRYRCRRTR